MYTKTSNIAVLALCVAGAVFAEINEKQRMTRTVAPLGVDVDTESYVSTLPYSASTSCATT